MHYQGSCHCGNVRFEVEGTLDNAMECNCSHCTRKGYLLWFVPRTQFKLLTAESAFGTYLFNKHVINHHFCTGCGCAPFASGKGPGGVEMAAINARCLENIDLATVARQFVDGRSR